MQNSLRLLFVFASLLTLGGNAHSQFGGSSGSLLGSTDEFLPVEEAYSVNVSFEDPQTLRVDWKMEPGYYLYRNRFAYHTAEETAFSQQYESGIVKFDEFYEEELEVYYDQTTVLLQSEFKSQELILEYQGCADAGLCYPPAFYKFQLDPELGSATFFGKVESAQFAGSSMDVIEVESASNIGFIVAVAFAFVGGIILNIMPCVFPVLSLKAMSLAKGTKNRTQLLSQGIFYALGSIAVSVGLAIALLSLRSAGEALGWGFQLQSPIIITVLLFLFMVMALSLSGAFVFGTSLMGLGQQLETGSKSSHSFMTGALAMFVASPCTAPFMGLALGYAIVQPWFIGLPVFAALGLGMALPILLLSMFPVLLEKMPKPGPWLETFKQLLAFPLYLTCIWLLWMLVRQIDSNGVALILTGLVLTILAIWAQQKLQGNVRWALFIAVMIAALFSAKVGVSMEPHETRQEATASLSLNHLDSTVGGPNPVFVNLTADWCITCLVNEKRALHTENTERLFEQHQVEYIVGDWTRQDSNISEILAKHGRVSVPLYLFYPAYSTQPEILPQFLTNDVIAELFE